MYIYWPARNIENVLSSDMCTPFTDSQDTSVRLTPSGDCLLHFIDFEEFLTQVNASLPSSLSTVHLDPHETHVGPLTSNFTFSRFIVISNAGLTSLPHTTSPLDSTTASALLELVRAFNRRHTSKVAYRVWVDGLCVPPGETEQARYRELGLIGMLYRHAVGHIILPHGLSELTGPTPSPSPTNATKHDAWYFDHWYAPLQILSHGRPDSTFVVWVPRSTPGERAGVGAPGRVEHGEEAGELVEITVHLEGEFFGCIFSLPLSTTSPPYAASPFVRPMLPFEKRHCHRHI